MDSENRSSPLPSRRLDDNRGLRGYTGAAFHPRLGEIVAAWVRLKPGVEATEEEIKEFCKGQIAYYKIPEHVRFVTEFPGDAEREDIEI
jgi:acyl-CoA synthetase (AMP-forming)/AMP-acid ligase II